MSSSDHKLNVSFLVVALTFSLGLGAFDRLPYLLYKYSDTPFLLIYFIATMFLVTPILLMEMYLGTPKTHQRLSFNLKQLIPKKVHFTILPLTILSIGMLVYFIITSFMPLLYSTIALNVFHGSAGEQFLSIANYNNFTNFVSSKLEYNFMYHFVFLSVIFIISTVILIDKGLVFRLITSAIFLLISVVVVFLLLITNTIYDTSIEYSFRTMLSFSFAGFGLNIESFHCVIDAIYYAFFTVGAGAGIMIVLSYKFSLSQKYLFKDVLAFVLIAFVFSIIVSYTIIAMLHNLGEAPSQVGIKSLYIDLPNYFYSVEDGKFLSILFYSVIGWCYFYTLSVILITIFTNLKVNYNIAIYQKFIIFLVFVALDVVMSSMDLNVKVLIKYVSHMYALVYYIMLPISIIFISVIMGYIRQRATYGAIYRSIVVDDRGYRRKLVLSVLFTVRVIIPMLGCFLLVVSILFW